MRDLMQLDLELQMAENKRRMAIESQTGRGAVVSTMSQVRRSLKKCRSTNVMWSVFSGSRHMAHPNQSLQQGTQRASLALARFTEGMARGKVLTSFDCCYCFSRYDLFSFFWSAFRTQATTMKQGRICN